MARISGAALGIAGSLTWLSLLCACGEDASSTGDGNTGDVAAPSFVAAPPAAAGAVPVGTNTGAIGADPAQPSPGVPSGAAGSTALPPAGGADDGGSTDPAGAGGVPADADPASVPQTPSTPAGPDDGDPSTPVVDVPGVACGASSSLFGLTTTNVSIGGRDVHLAYPCGKHSGAPVTFILNLHGTMPTEDLKLYQVAYFSASAHADSHSFITVAPKSVVSQWGNGDGGVDRPHIMEVIEWVYTTFADLDIRQMWVAGHSWGAMYSTTFACDPAIADKVRGVMLQSGSGMNPACADRLSVISSAAESDIGPVINQGGVPASHGCGAAQTAMVGNNVETYWPGCNPGFTHANYFMLGKAHADYMDAVVVERIADLINLARP